MGGSPYMNMGHRIDTGMSMGMGSGPSRPSIRNQSRYICQRHAPLDYNPPGPPLAHSFMPTQRAAHLPFRYPPHSPFTSSRTTLFENDDSDDDEFEDEYSLPMRQNFGRYSRGDHRHASRYPPRRRSYRSSMYKDSEDELKDYDDYEDDFDDEDGLDGYFSQRGPPLRW
ncbi:hypothetical protein DE146DRAFT_792399 [Phaeosphaeria sp. MPI-PUGE-AT-0046c]|nr:hypothetical protein DE146DRAFT_792399 [Phaeosphaeria sp. MPI-PUGE-AT-0046c]